MNSLLIKHFMWEKYFQHLNILIIYEIGVRHQISEIHERNYNHKNFCHLIQCHHWNDDRKIIILMSNANDAQTFSK